MRVLHGVMPKSPAETSTIVPLCRSGFLVIISKVSQFSLPLTTPQCTERPASNKKPIIQMKLYKTTFNFAAVAASTLALAATSANAATVWNINVGGGAADLTTYVGAAAENAGSTTWNAVSSTGSVILADSIGDASAGVSFEITPGAGSAIDFGSQSLVAGDDIFDTWIKDGDAGASDTVNDDPFTVTFGNLSISGSYDLVVYSDWNWGPNALPVAQTVGTGLTGNYIINSSVFGGSNGTVGPLLEDANSANVAGDSNFARFNLIADGSGNITLQIGTAGNVNHPTNGFQLVAVPEPSSTALLGLGGLALILRRRR